MSTSRPWAICGVAGLATVAVVAAGVAVVEEGAAVVIKGEVVAPQQ